MSPHQSISLRIAAASPHDVLIEPDKSKILSAARTITLLYEHHNLFMMYLESCMQIVAPNLCKLVGYICLRNIKNIYNWAETNYFKF